ncbi:Homeodomain-like DNA binding domain-containing transcription factor [Phycomyces blakesleeanus NRRL 1555(-)]|uniref:Homeodomain-like DNA binding domain-containing transcription factor n=1 Tax=Phycomyces blakesleeanus (strain ATCC 8743b / DSM 1359 / FGSC 10004 / NBRC 33097 / NRRL 1555) TaxID=763407 RepID=A0A162NG94_PHYB8|nr:Homeodomain-like DNA binding domain-containing transcription factor [Phycomyces blakesleeanus NRRL 1555(-)]OAD69294.1 Homeodomain-like DNA binding domain-containing transcription factor [Phycomyces blakesleeanus NRRL 1555(-)]|eukprot:XP_018287334.1 Homeodomain-like DNA binding domain-containing transcription factor [Phycomyces blakesleeanus NRRL 1555(-)]
MPKEQARLVRGPYQKLSEFRKGIIIGLYKSGMIVAKIAVMENVSRYTITRIIDKFKRTGSVADNKSPGRPKITTQDKKQQQQRQ